MEIQKTRFYQLVYDSTLTPHARFNIGTYREKKLHLVLKQYFEPDPACREVPCAGFIADILRDDEIIEIETSGFTGLRDKLAAFLPQYRVHLVFPLSAQRWISWIDPQSGEITPKRRSPKTETIYHALFECIYILEYLNHPNLSIWAPSMEILEYRLLDGWSRDRKRGSHRYERMPLDLYDIAVLEDAASYAAVLPPECRETCTVRSFSEKAGVNLYTARAILKVLQVKGVLREDGKDGRQKRYRCLAVTSASTTAAGRG